VVGIGSGTTIVYAVDRIGKPQNEIVHCIYCLHIANCIMHNLWNCLLIYLLLANIWSYWHIWNRNKGVSHDNG